MEQREEIEELTEEVTRLKRENYRLLDQVHEICRW